MTSMLVRHPRVIPATFFLFLVYAIAFKMSTVNLEQKFYFI